MSKQKFYIALVILLTFAFTTKALASLNLGSATLSASGNTLTLSTSDTNNNILIQPNGTGKTLIGSTFSAFGTNTLESFAVVSFDAVGFGPQLTFRRAGNSFAAPSAVTAGQTLHNIGGQGFDGTAFATGGNMGVSAAENFTPTAHGAQYNFGTVPVGETGLQNRVQILNFGALSLGVSTVNTPAWGTSGVVLRTTGSQMQDTSSSGTVAAAVGSSFASPLFSATSITTYTNAANVYIAGDVAAGTNVTLTNSYGLWNVGKTRLDGAVTLNGKLSDKMTTLTYASPTVIDPTLGNTFVVTTVNATGSVTFNAASGGTAGQHMYIIIKNDATSGKTITFGTNFLPQAATLVGITSKSSTIEFISDGTSWYEISRIAGLL